jgi:hypothetical protein
MTTCGMKKLLKKSCSSTSTLPLSLSPPPPPSFSEFLLGNDSGSTWCKTDFKTGISGTLAVQESPQHLRNCFEFVLMSKLNLLPF